MSSGHSGQSSLSPEQFKESQKAGWNNVAQGWKRWWNIFELSAQTLSNRMVELAKVKPGDKVLDIATGIGEPAITAAKRLQNKGQVIATDISPEMLAIAKERAKELGLDSIMFFEESDAEAYPYPTSTFNSATSRWGLMFFPNYAQTLQKIRNSLVGDGIFVASVWSMPENTPMLTVPLNRASAATGIPAPTKPGIMGPFKFADPSELKDSLAQAGFSNIVTEKMNLNFTFKSVDNYIDFSKSVNGPVVAMIKSLPVEKQQDAWQGLAGDMKKYVDNNTGVLKLNNEVIVSAASIR